jgi:hypothetical protein
VKRQLTTELDRVPVTWNRTCTLYAQKPPYGAILSSVFSVLDPSMKVISVVMGVLKDVTHPIFKSQSPWSVAATLQENELCSEVN